MNEPMHYLTARDRQTLDEMYRDLQAWRAMRGRRKSDKTDSDPGVRWFLGEVIETGGIDVAADEDTPSFGEVRIKKLEVPDGGDPEDPEREIVTATRFTDEDATIEHVYNVSTTYSYDEGDRCLVAMLTTGLHIILPLSITSGGGGGGGGGCGCTCIDRGDITVDGVETTSLWSVYLSEIRDKQTYGDIILPAGYYELEYDEGGNYWFLNVGDLLIAQYSSGADATAAVTMDGTLTFYKSNGGRTKLILQITGTVPQDPEEFAEEAGFAAGYAAGYADGYAGNPPLV